MYRHVLEQLDDTKKKIENIYSEYSDITEDNNNDNNSDIVQLNNLYRNNITVKIICNIIVITQYDAIAEAVKTKEIQVLYNPHPEDRMPAWMQMQCFLLCLISLGLPVRQSVN